MRVFLAIAAAVIVAATFCETLRRAPAEGRRPRGESDALHSFEWWYAQRALPGDRIPQGAFEKASARSLRMRKEKSAATSSWKSLGPTNIGGRTLAIAVNPATPTTVWAGAASGGLWKSTTGGQGLNAWSHVNTGFNTISVSAIVIDPAAPATMYIGTGEISLYQRPLLGVVGARASYGMGVLKSTDAGTSWYQTGLTYTFPQITAIERLIINPLKSSTLYAATSEGVFKTTDAGASWSLSNPVLMAMDLVINPADTSILYSSHGNSDSSPNPGVYRTTNAGSSWTLLGGGLPTIEFGRTALAISTQNPPVVYAGVSNSVSYETTGLFKSTDAGGTWSMVSSAPYVGTQGWYNNVVAVDPDHPDTVYCSGFTIDRSTNGGGNLGPLTGSGSVHVDHHAIAFDPTDSRTIYVGSDGGIWKSTDGGTSFINLNNNYCTTQFYPGFAVYQSDSVTSLGGLQDNGTLAYSGSSSWFQVYGADGGWCAINPTNKSIQYAESQWGDILRSTDGGASFHDILAGLPPSQYDYNFLSPFVLSPSSPSVLYAGSKNVYKTTNGGTSWFSSNGASTLNGTNISCIGVSWGSPDTILAGTGDGRLGVTPVFDVFRSVNGGMSWTKVSNGLPHRYPTYLQFDPTNSAIAYLTFSGYGTEHLFKSTDAGLTWAAISGGLPDMPLQAVAVDPESPQDVYVGSDLGVYHSSDGGTSWENFNAGMPPAMVLDVVVSESGGTLRAATFGNGIFQRPLLRVPQLALVRPAGGQVFSSGIPMQIGWTEKFIASVTLEFSSDGGGSWETIASGVDASSRSYSWAVPEIATTTGRIRITSGGGFADSSSAFTILVNPDIQGGWNLISLNVRPTDPRKTTLFPTAGSRAFEFSHTYATAESLQPGRGYWLKFAEPQDFTLPGDSLGSDTIDVNQGWNMIGSIGEKIPAGSVAQIPANNIRSPYYNYFFGYHIADSLRPKRGYWVKAGAAGKLILAPGSNAALRKGAPASDPPGDRLTIAGDGGVSGTLFFARAGECPDPSYYELPPSAPGESFFDVRYVSGRCFEEFHGGEEFAIKVSRFPVTVKWDIREIPSASLSIDGREIPIAGEGFLTIASEPGHLALRIPASGAAKPLACRLLQNYPNPFNPATTIRYSIGARTRVVVEIFTLLGERVSRLVDEVQDEGEHSVVWHAESSPSGVYFCRLSAAGGAAGVRKLVIAR